MFTNRSKDSSNFNTDLISQSNIQTNQKSAFKSIPFQKTSDSKLLNSNITRSNIHGSHQNIALKDNKNAKSSKVFQPNPDKIAKVMDDFKVPDQKKGLISSNNLLAG